MRRRFGQIDIQRCRKMFLKTICLEKPYLSAPFTFSVRALYTNLQSDFVGFGQISHTLHALSHSSMRVCGCSKSPQIVDMHTIQERSNTI